jgi:dihydroorotate dehydrogenase (fumarate)
MDLSTTYMNLELKNPLVPSASPLTSRLDHIRELEDAGAGAVVLHSLFEEQIRHDSTGLEFYLQYGTERFAESLTYFPHPKEFRFGPEEYLDLVSKARDAVDIPVIGSLNGISTGGWISYAKKIEDAGADGLELNVYYIPTDPRLTAEEVEEVYLSVLREVKATVSIPVAMKLSPYFSSMANMAQRLAAAGADGLVLFNRFYQPDIDEENLEVKPRLVLSTSAEMRLPLRWIAILYGKLRASLAATTGVHTGRDVAKLLLAGADVTMMASALLQHGVARLGEIRQGLVEYMEEKGYESVAQMRGVLSQKSCPEPSAFERANYMKTLTGYGPTTTME